MVSNIDAQEEKVCSEYHMFSTSENITIFSKVGYGGMEMVLYIHFMFYASLLIAIWIVVINFQNDVQISSNSRHFGDNCTFRKIKKSIFKYFTDVCENCTDFLDYFFFAKKKCTK